MRFFMIKVLLLSVFFIFNLHAGMLGDAFKDTAKAGVVIGVKKALDSEIGTQAIKGAKEKLHKNSKEYAGETHVYSIKNEQDTYKVGESSQGKKMNEKSKRAETQVSKLKKETGDDTYESKILKEFSNKKEARDYETKVIERYRAIYGKNKSDKSLLIGNKTNR